MRMLFACETALIVVVSAAACADAQGPTSPVTTPTISALSPSAGPVGTMLVISGSGFAATGNTIRFGTGYIRDVPSADGRTIRLTIPGGVEQCPPPAADGPIACTLLARVVTPGAYLVAVMSGNQTSNELPFTVRAQ